MSKKKLFILAAGYALGNFVSSLYNKKKPDALKKELEKAREKGDGDLKVYVDNFITTHKNLLEDLKTHVMTEENKELFTQKKGELLKVVDTYKKQGQDLVDELKSKGKEFLVEASDNLNKLYEEKKDEINSLKDIIPEKARELKDDIKEEIKGAVKDIKK